MYFSDDPVYSTCSVVVITVVSHTAGPQFEPGQVQRYACIVGSVDFVFFCDSALLNPTKRNLKTM